PHTVNRARTRRPPRSDAPLTLGGAMSEREKRSERPTLCELGRASLFRWSPPKDRTASPSRPPPSTPRPLLWARGPPKESSIHERPADHVQRVRPDLPLQRGRAAVLRGARARLAAQALQRVPPGAQGGAE